MKNFKTFSLFAIPLAASLWMSACSPASPKLIPRPEEVSEKVDLKSDSVESKPVVDILFVVDDSGSMQPHQVNLSSNIDQFLNAFLQNNQISFQVGVITTDMDEDNRKGQLTGNPYRYMDQNTPNLLSRLKQNILMGSNGSAWEKTFEPIKAALTMPLIQSYNKGFLRPEAYLAIIYLGDEDDQSSITGSDLMNTLIQIKGHKRKILSYGVLNSFPDPSNYCRTGSTYQQRLVQFFQSTVNSKNNNNMMSLCDPNFGTKLAKFSQDLIRFLNGEVKLNRAPILSSIRVTYGTQEIKPDFKTGWFYDPSTNTIILGDEVVLDENQPAGATLQVSFDSIAFPETGSGS